MRSPTLLASLITCLLSSPAHPGWKHPKPIVLKKGPYSLCLRPGLGAVIKVGHAPIVQGNRIMLRSKGRHSYIASQWAPKIVREETAEQGTLVVSEENPKALFRYTVRLTLSDSGKFSYVLDGQLGDVGPSTLQQDFMLASETFAGTDFVAAASNGMVTGQVPLEPRPMNDRWLVKTDISQYTFRTQIGPIVVQTASAQLNDFRPVDWVKVKGVLLYMNRPYGTGDKVHTKLTMQLPTPRRNVEAKTLALKAKEVDVVHVPTQGSDHWALDLSGILPHRVSGPNGVARVWASGDLPKPPVGLTRWVQGVPFLLGDHCVVLHGWMDMAGRYPGAVTGLPVNRKATTIAFLHACTYPAKPGEPVVRYVIHYEDGSQQDVPVRFREGIDELLSRSDVAARAILGVTDRGGVLSAFVSRWDNPHSDRLISKIDVQSGRTAGCPILFAVTLESGGRGK